MADLAGLAGMTSGASGANGQEWSIHEVVRVTGTTSRTLRHYDRLGLLTPSRTGPGGVRFYDEDGLLRLQRILLLRGLGLSLPLIADALASEPDLARALRTHLVQLERERDRVERQIRSVRRTIEAREGGEQLMADDMFDGFDHTRYQEEVEQRWGRQAYADSDRWWRTLSADDRRAWKDRVARLGADWNEAARRGVAPDSDEAQSLARRHAEWLGGIPGTPGSETGRPTKEYVLGLGEMYVADPGFSANYGGAEGATFVRDALTVYAERHL
jgi:DNA-binding transcriptional MerR regulator